MTVVTVADVEARLGRLNDTERAAFPVLAGNIEAELAALLRRPIEATVIVGEAHYLDSPVPFVVLNSTPVLSIQRVQLQNGFAPTTFGDIDATMYLQTYAGVQIAWSAWLPDVGDSTLWPLASIFDYTAGLTPAASAGYAALKSVTAARIARVLRKIREDIGEEVTQLSVEGYLVYLEADGFTANEVATVRPFRRPMIR